MFIPITCFEKAATLCKSLTRNNTALWRHIECQELDQSPRDLENEEQEKHLEELK